METAVEHMIGFSVALTGIIVLLAMMGLEVRKIDRQLAEIERLHLFTDFGLQGSCPAN